MKKKMGKFSSYFLRKSLILFLSLVFWVFREIINVVF